MHCRELAPAASPLQQQIVKQCKLSENIAQSDSLPHTSAKLGLDTFVLREQAHALLQQHVQQRS